MAVSDLVTTLRAAATAGVAGLPAEQRAALETSLPLTRREVRARRALQHHQRDAWRALQRHARTPCYSSWPHSHAWMHAGAASSHTDRVGLHMSRHD